MPAKLEIVSEQSGRRWEVWPVPDAIPSGEVHETGSYLFELHRPDGAEQADLLVDQVPLEALRTPSPAMARWRWTPGFNAGTVDVELRISGTSPRRFEVETDPDRRKLTREDFDAMVREILEDTFALFSLGSFRRSIARGAGNRPPAIARLEFLRSRIDELEKVVSEIARTPRQRLDAREAVLPYHRVQRASGPEVARSFRTGMTLQEQGEVSRLPPVLRGFLPAKIRVRRRFTSTDLPEHRQMAACIRAWKEWLEQCAGLLEPPAAANDRTAQVWLRRCRQLSRKVGGLLELPPFEGAGNARPQLVLTSLFRNDRRYRTFYQLWRDMNLGLAAVFGDFLSLPLSRTYDLYELWCFLRLLRASAEAFGGESMDFGRLFTVDDQARLTLASGAVTVKVGPDVQLCFQKPYREFWTTLDREGSYSRTMVPDIVLVPAKTGTGRTRIIVFDAKYRIDEGLNDALSSIHTYRDAIVAEEEGKIRGMVDSAYLLSPHTPRDLQTDYRATAMPGRLFHPLYRASFRFGAATLRPGMALTEVASLLNTIVHDAAGKAETTPANS